MTSVPNPSLDAGQRALNQGNYSVAIAHLEGVCETELDDSLVARASQELVRAYSSIGDIQKAIALCQHLTQHPEPDIREWATNTLVDLAAQQPATSDSTGFAPLDGMPPGTPASDSTGFVALDQTPSKPNKPLRVKPSNIKQRLSDSTKGLFSGEAQLPRSNQTQAGQKGTTPTQAPADARGQSLGSESENSQVNSESTTETSSRLPVGYSPPSSPRPRWRNSGRAKDWRPLKRPKLSNLWFVEIATAIALFWVLRFVVQFIMGTTNTILVQLPFLEPIDLFYNDPTPALWVFLAILVILSPWLIDGLLKWFHGLEPLPLTQLATRSPEAAQVVQRFCRQRRLPVPKLGILPTDAPVALTYGNLPRTARIVVSEGLLSQLADDEIATIYGGQLGHIVHRDFVLMSLGLLITQLPYTIYWQVAQWGEGLAESIERKLPSYRRFLPALLLGITGAIACVSYGTYWVLRLPLLWFSRSRLYYSDRLAVETTGNPNGMTRALLKMAIGITEDIQALGKTSGLLESFDLLLPVGYRQAIILGSSSPQTPFEAALNWECTNPYRDWLIITASHPLMGERSHLLARYAHFWKLGTELDLPTLTPPIRDNKARLSKLGNSYKALPLLQSALLYGLVLGVVLRVVLWLIGQIGDFLNIWQVIWMHNARAFLPFLNACVLIAFSLTIFLWINRYFPDIKPSTVQTEPNLGDFFAEPTTLPPDSQPVQLTGKLLGRRGLLNWLGQDLILQTSTGLVKLHFFSYLGPFGNFLPQSTRPSDLVNQQVTVTGWFRRGVTPWIDIETLRTQGGRVTRANYPIWITMLALIAAAWGAYQIWLV
jgi:Zn-dependent protease with chaperone function